MKTIEVQIRGDSPLLMHRFGEEAQGDVQKKTRAVNIKNETPRDAAEKVVYRNSSGDLYFPSAAIARLLREAGGSHKQRGSRKSLKFVIPAAVRMADDTIQIVGPDGKPVTDYEVDSRPVTIPATKGRVMRHRPRLDEWGAKFRLVVNDEIIDVETVQQLLTEGGQRNGIGDFRPEKGGPFGCFQIVSWK